MAALAGIVAHGGVIGAFVEGLIAVAVTAVLIAVWLRERKAGREGLSDGPARLRDDDETPS